MNFQQLKERINLALYDSKTKVLSGLNFASLIVSMIVIGGLFYSFGFPATDETKALIVTITKSSLLFYIIKYILNIVYSYEVKKFIKDTRIEGLLMLFIIINFLSSLFCSQSILDMLSENLQMLNLENFTVFFIQIFFFVIVLIEVSKASSNLSVLQLSPPRMLILSFIILILLGAGLLMMPEMTKNDFSMPFGDALFTSISASCVTGLIVVDTATYFTEKGQLIIMLLIQFGGLNIISFATFFALFNKKGLGIKHQTIIQESFSSDSLLSSKGLMIKIFKFSFIIEALGTLLIFLLWSPKLDFNSTGDKFFYSIFHSISAFNNAGFSLFSDGLYDHYVSHSHLLHVVFVVLIFFGSLGFPTIQDIFGFDGFRERIRRPWKKYSLGARLSLYFSLGLLALGTIVFFALEYNNTLAEQNLGEKGITSLFQSMTTRTAGFNTVDFSQLTQPTLLFFLFLMFIGASPGSTGGGIKTTTFAIIIMGAYSTIRGRKRLEISQRTIPRELLNKAYSILLFSMSAIFIGVFTLSITDQHLPLIDLIFEEVSAFSTVGLSTGITSELSNGGRIVIMISMFVGRIGTLTLAFALSKKTLSSRFEYPKENVMVG